MDPYLRRAPASLSCRAIPPPSLRAHNSSNCRTAACGCDSHRAESARETAINAGVSEGEDEGVPERYVGGLIGKLGEL